MSKAPPQPSAPRWPPIPDGPPLSFGPPHAPICDVENLKAKAEQPPENHIFQPILPIADMHTETASCTLSELPQRCRQHYQHLSGHLANARKARPLRLKSVPAAEIRAEVQRSSYDRFPGYLKETMELLDEEEDYINSLPNTALEPEHRPLVRLMTESERGVLAEGLLAKKEQVTRCFEADLVLHHEDVWKRRVIERYAPQLCQINTDINYMNRKYIFVSLEA